MSTPSEPLWKHSVYCAFRDNEHCTCKERPQPWLQDADVTLYHGDVLAVLPSLEAESVDCVVTSPPYWGLRDYGTGAWEGGDEGCDHLQAQARPRRPERDGGWRNGVWTEGAWTENEAAIPATQYRDTCGKCGATRIDQQLGLEPTPEEYVTRMVEVFREVRRVLAAHGTVWLNLGDSYNANQGKGFNGQVRQDHANRHTVMKRTGFKPKDLVGIPWRVAFALQADGWYLRSDIIWAKPNPMPESVTDRPTKAHEYVFLLSKQPRYFFDQEAVREASTSPEQEAHNQRYAKVYEAHSENVANGAKQPGNVGSLGIHSRPGPGGRNIRSVWEIATQPYPEAHFATFPEELARRCIAAGCPEQVCRVCGKARERMVERGELVPDAPGYKQRGSAHPRDGFRAVGMTIKGDPAGKPAPNHHYERLDGGFTECACSSLSNQCSHCGWRPVDGNICPACNSDVTNPPVEKYRPGVTLDPFMGSGTVAHAARKLGRHAIGIDLNESYLELAARRLQQQSLFAEAAS